MNKTQKLRQDVGERALGNAVAGFTLVELMVTVAVLAILITLAVPSFRDLLSNSRSATLTNELVFSLKLARSEAIKRGVFTEVCPRANAEAATCSASADDWSNGWVVRITEGCIDDCEVLYDSRQGVPSHEVRYSQTRVPFDRSGRLLGSIGGTFTICDPAVKTSARRVVLSGSGRTRLVRLEEGCA